MHGLRIALAGRLFQQVQPARHVARLLPAFGQHHALRRQRVAVALDEPLADQGLGRHLARFALLRRGSRDGAALAFAHQQHPAIQAIRAGVALADQAFQHGQRLHLVAVFIQLDGFGAARIRRHGGRRMGRHRHRGHGCLLWRGRGAHAHGQGVAGGQHGQAGRGQDQDLGQLVAAALAGDLHGAQRLLLAAQRLAQHGLHPAVEQPVAGTRDEQAGQRRHAAAGEEPGGDGGGQRGQRALPPELLGQPRVDLAQGAQHAGAHIAGILGGDDIDVRVVRVAAEHRFDHVRIQFRGGHVAQRRQ